MNEMGSGKISLLFQLTILILSPFLYLKTDAKIGSSSTYGLGKTQVNERRWEGNILNPNPHNVTISEKTQYVMVWRKFERGSNSSFVQEGQSIELYCHINREENENINTQQFKVAWRIKSDGPYLTTDKLKGEGGKETLSNLDQRYKYEETWNLTKISFGNVTLNDKGFYQCALWDNKICPHFNTTIPRCIVSTFEIQLRVKQTMEIYYPLLSIAVEVALLFIVIVVYEKRTSKTEVEESDTDGSPDQ